MNSLETRSLPAIASALLMMSIALVGWFAYKHPSPAGPPDYWVSSAIPSSGQDIIARLWEDPLQAIQDHIAASSTNSQSSPSGHRCSNDPSELKKAILARCGGSSLVLLPISIPGTGFPDDVEARLRSRYALQMAMAQDGYRPENRDHLGFVQIQLTSGPASATTKFALPYELFAPATHEKPWALVLWLPDDALRENPVGRLAQIQSEIVPNSVSLSGHFVVGPASSDTLQGIISSLSRTDEYRPRTNDLNHLKNKLRFYSALATSPDALLGLKPTNEWTKTRCDLDARFARFLDQGNGTPHGEWQYFVNAISTDDQLTDLLVQELKYRNISPTVNGKDRILILAEADTFHGRSLPIALTASLLAVNQTNEWHIPTNSPTALLFRNSQGSIEMDGNRITVARYLRGLDKSKSRQKPEAIRKDWLSQSPEEAFRDLFKRVSAPADGESQLDYAERLGLQLKQLGQSGDGRPIRAVGIMGGEVQDKLILLWALRRHFPEALFFTTELDVRLWHPEVLAYTRNLIIASSHAVTPETTCNSTIPAFRDSYQAALFEACRYALRDAKTGDTHSCLRPRSPKLFELGRNGPVELTYFHGWGQPKATIGGVLDDCFSRATWGGFGGIILAAIGLTAIGHCLTRESRWGLPNLLGRSTGWSLWFALATAIASLVFMLASSVIARQPGGEPWRWMDGVSSWPTEFGRIVALGLILWVFTVRWIAHCDQKNELTIRYFGVPDSLASQRRTLLSSLRIMFTIWPLATAKGSGIPKIIDIHSNYLERSSLLPRSMRIVTATVLYTAFAFGLSALLNTPPLPGANVRGALATGLDRWLVLSLLFLFWALIFYVIDSVWLSTQLLRRIQNTALEWPETAYATLPVGSCMRMIDKRWLLQVQFTAEKTRDTAHLLFLPFAIQLIILAARNSYFDNWNWPPALQLLCLANLILAVASWVSLRREAGTVRRSSLSALSHLICRLNAAMLSLTGPRKSRVARRLYDLEEHRRIIAAEQRGAFAKLVQDPTLLIMLLPTGALGVLPILVQLLFSRG